MTGWSYVAAGRGAARGGEWRWLELYGNWDRPGHRGWLELYGSWDRPSHRTPDTGHLKKGFGEGEWLELAGWGHMAAGTGPARGGERRWLQLYGSWERPGHGG